MKTIYKILLFTIILQTSAFSQFEVLSVIKPTTSVEPCDGKINLEFVESELPYQLDFTSSAGQSGSFTVTSTVFSLPDLCPGNIAIHVVDNHGCSTEKDVVLEECGIEVTFNYSNLICGINNYWIHSNIISGDNLRFTWSNGEVSKNLFDINPGKYSVTVVDDFEVIAGTNGRGEVDLMKLVIKPSGFLSKCKVYLEYTGDIAFYNKSTKGPKITKMEFDATKIYHLDAPSLPIIGFKSAYAFFIIRQNFQEFARVSFGIDIIGEVQEGSRCSPKYLWESNYAAISNGSFHPSDPHNGTYQKLEPYNTGGIKHSIPRKINGYPAMPTGTAIVTINPKSVSSILTYKLKYNTTSNKWDLPTPSTTLIAY